MRIVFYGRTQVGSVVLSYLVAKGHEVKVIPEDDLVRSLAKMYRLDEVTLDTMGEFDLFVCCHGEKIIKPEHLKLGRFINMHSCLWKYKGKDPISRYIKNGDTEASIESHYMVEEVDGGEVIERVLFTTPVVKTHGEYFNLALPHYYTCIDRTLKKLGVGKAVAMTRYRGNIHLLKGWVRYYSRYFDKLIVFYGLNVDTTEFASLDIETIPLGDDTYSSASHEKVWQKQKELFSEYEWVLYTDPDERVVPEPNLYKDLRDFMDRSRELQTFCEGWEVIRQENEQDFNWLEDVTSQRTLMCRDLSGSYNKPALSRVPTNWALGFHYIERTPPDEIKAIEHTGLYMFHLKHVSSTEAPNHCDKTLKKIPSKFGGKF